MKGINDLRIKLFLRGIKLRGQWQETDQFIASWKNKKNLGMSEFCQQDQKLILNYIQCVCG